MQFKSLLPDLLRTEIKHREDCLFPDCLPGVFEAMMFLY